MYMILVPASFTKKQELYFGSEAYSELCQTTMIDLLAQINR